MTTRTTRPDLADPSYIVIVGRSATDIELVGWRNRYLKKHPEAHAGNIQHDPQRGEFRLKIERRDST